MSWAILCRTAIQVYVLIINVEEKEVDKLYGQVQSKIKNLHTRCAACGCRLEFHI